MSENHEVNLAKINEAINLVRPYLHADGGDVELVELTDDNTVKVRLTGACDGCPFSVMTLRAGIEQAIRKKFPEMKELVAV
ncbi:MAG: NifU family protein [Bacteroidales bacterium]|jgi:Fe-S cluster biogenesis protein NfuA|nr:NifU family protein [Bacteroidales bacterium]